MPNPSIPHGIHLFATTGPLLVAFLGLFIGIFKIWLFARNRADSWNAWSGGLSFSLTVYATGVFFQYSLGAQALNVLVEKIQYTGVVLLVHCAYGYALAYGGSDTRRYVQFAVPVHGLVLILLWGGDWIIADRFVFRRFLFFEHPYVEPRVTVFGVVLLGYFSLVALRIWHLCISRKRFSPLLIVGISAWILGGVHDALATVGMPTVQFLMEYGALVFIVTVAVDSFRHYFAIHELAEERKAKIEKDNARLARILQAMGEGLVVTDARGRIQMLNAAAAAMGGVSFGQAMGRQFRNVFELVPETTASGAAGATVPVDPVPMVMVTPDGRRTPVALTESRLPADADAGGTGKVYVLRDISALKRQQRALIDSQRTLKTVLDSIDATIAVSDFDTHEVVFMNRRMKALHGENAVGRKCHEIFAGRPRPCDRCKNETLVDDAGRPTGPVLWEAQNSLDNRWYVYLDRAVFWVDGRLVKLQIATDITQIKRLESERGRMAEKLQEARRMEAIATLAGGVAHEFNNLLMGIQGRSSLLSRDNTMGPESREHLRGIDACIERASTLTRQLLGFARGGKYEVRRTDLNALIREAVGVFGRSRRRVAVEEDYAMEIWPVRVDRAQVEQVISNILDNAHQAMSHGGKVTIQTRNAALDEGQTRPFSILAGRYVQVTITDTGVGMDAETMGKIFDPFFTTRKKARGTGLGLASAYGIIRNHGGMIQVESAPNQGASFTVSLPAAEARAEVEPGGLAFASKDRRTILLVDDEVVVADIGQEMLARLGYETLVAPSGEEAVEIHASMGDRIDLVILDMVMPGLGGRETFQLLRKRDPAVKILLSSGYSLDGEAGGIMALGCNGFLQKPFDLETLARTVQDILGKSNASEPLEEVAAVADGAKH